MRRPASHVATAYTRRYVLDVGGVERHDQYMLMHPNGLVLVGIAPSHALFHAHLAHGSAKAGGAVTPKPVLRSVDYALGGTRSVAAMPSGKRKRGGDVFTSDDILCRLVVRVRRKGEEEEEEEVDEIYEPRACIRGKLLEVNDALLDTCPSPLISHCGSEGYLCVLLPRDEDYELALKTGVTPEEYARLRGEYEGEEMHTNGMREKMRGPAVACNIGIGL